MKTTYAPYSPPTTEQIRAAMKKRGLSGSAAARICGVNPRTVRRWTGGNIPMPYAAWELLQAAPIAPDSNFGATVGFWSKPMAVVRIPGMGFSAEFEQRSDGCWHPTAVTERAALAAAIDAASEDDEAIAAQTALDEGRLIDVPRRFVNEAFALIEKFMRELS